MTEQIETSSLELPAADSAGASDRPALVQRAVDLADERPEVAAGAAFAGGLVLAMILKRIAR